jgi:pimeloyl-ACP methyl ester carboxylesterase
MTAPGAVLVHGLWHGAWCWNAVRAALDARGVPSVAVELPLTPLEDDTRVARDALDRFGRPAVLVGHFYGGAVVTAAGTHPLVRELVHLAAYALDDGESVSRTATRADSTRCSVRSCSTAARHPTSPLRLPPGCGRCRAPCSATCRRWSPGGRCPRPTSCARSTRSSSRRGSGRWQRAPPLEWPCGHSPVATRPESVADLVAERVRAVS